ncbi:hypothetical protein CBG25_01855 [Arsenophonus sp. ENCA]|uniref:hypothetical protein n=1 Tax=Arsenophonus sp. ENCA TaxID=1987579 RepID=UPI000BCD27AA|nr:hypothetical protein [Arsenophonus sp. ENCA]PAV10483.1 hypothetical protein CBG25_01855 [Arsenophonus sp. ENCA]
MSDINTNFFQAMAEKIMTVLGHAVAGKAAEYATLLETVTGGYKATIKHKTPDRRRHYKCAHLSLSPAATRGFWRNSKGVKF